jgi:hypothetical protein
MLRVLEFVDKSDCVVCEGNPAVALCVDDKVIFAKAEFARALARFKECSRAEVGPIDAALLELPKRVDVSVDYGHPFLGNVSGLPQRDARCDEKAARSADYDEPGSTGFLDAFDKAIRRADELI